MMRAAARERREVEANPARLAPYAPPQHTAPASASPRRRQPHAGHLPGDRRLFIFGEGSESPCLYLLYPRLTGVGTCTY